MNWIKVIIYNYYRFYKSLTKNDPVFLSVIAFMASIYMFIIINIEIINKIWKFAELSDYFFYGISAVIVIATYFLLYKKGTIYEIIKEKPVFLNNGISIVMTICFFLVCFFPLFYLGFIL